MAPRLRSSSRNTSRNTTRPTTPLDAPATAPAAKTTSSTSETARHKKQRKTGRETSAPVDFVEEPERQKGRKSAGSQMETVQEQPEQQPEEATTTKEEIQSEEAPRSISETWVEPPLRTPTPTYREQGLEKTSVLSTMQPLGSKPTTRILRQVGLAPPPMPPPRPAPKKKVGKIVLRLSSPPKNGDEGPKTASTSADEGPLSDSSRAEGIIQGVLERQEPAARVTRSRSGKDRLEDEPAAVNNNAPAGPSVPLSLKYTTGKLGEILGSAISRAEESKDSKVADGLRWIKEASASDPFLLSILEGVINRPVETPHRAAFQAVMRDAIKRVRAQDDTNAANELARTRSATTSSLSSAKSLDATTFAPAVASDSANVPVPAKGKAAPAAASKAKGKGRAGPPKTRSGPPPADAFSRKRKLEEDPEFSEEAIAAKRRALEKATITDSAVEESNVRTAIEPPAGFVFPATCSVRSVSEEPGRRPAVGPVVGKDRVPPKPAGGTASERVRKPKVQAEEIDNIDFCRACEGSGQLLCCDGCVDSFHFTCLDPPVDPNSPPEGQWFCPSCAKKGLLGGLAEVMDTVPQTGFQLPSEVRGFFSGVETGDRGEYTEVTELPKGISSRVRTTRLGRAEEQNPLRFKDSKGNVIVCMRCGLTSEGRRPIIQCDYCPSSWHLDCLDPPLANPPRQKPGSDNPLHYWKCPNHIEHDLSYIGCPGRVRRPRNPKFVDIEVLPDSDGESFGEQEQEGTVYRVSERGIILDFVSRVKRQHAEEEAKAARAARLAREAQISGPSRTEAGSNPAFSRLLPTEQQAVMGLLGIAGQSPVDRAGHVVSQLIAGASDAFRNATSEIEILQSLQEVVGKRIQSLTSASAPTN